ncbi:hypothetical protein Scep_021083 [Stephania cephalantha]|uniref:Uncharacterized protein n=1 Tax=Stephania cephalantha TaxID=152367 RepID=A0AAP0F3Q8_9MAGN
MIDRNAVHEERARSSLFDSSNMEIAGCNNAVEEPEVLKNEQSSCSSVELIDSNASLNETMRKRKTCEGASPDATVVKVLRRKCTSVDAEKAESKAICEIVTASPLAQIESNLDHGKAVTQNPGISYEAPRGDSPDVLGLEVPSIKCSNEYADKVQQKPTGVHGTAFSLALTESTLDHGKATMQNLGLSNEATKGVSPDVSLVVEAPGRKCTSEDANEVQSKTTCEHGTAPPLAQIEPAINHDKATRETASNVSMSKVFRRKCSYLDTDKVQLETTREDGAASPCAPIDSTPDHEKAGLQDLEISNKATRAASPDVLAVKASNRNFTFGVASRLRSKTLAHGKCATRNLGISNADRRGPSPDVLVVEMPTRKCTSKDAVKVTSKTTCEHGVAHPLYQVESGPDHGKAAMQNPEKANEVPSGCSLTNETHLTDSGIFYIFLITVMTAGSVFIDAVPQMKHDVHGTSSESIRQSTTKLLPEKLDFIFKGEKLIAPKLEQVEMNYPPVEIERKMTDNVKAEAIELGDFHCSVTVVTRSYLVRCCQK